MKKIELYTRLLEYVATIELPPFEDEHMPEVVRWGVRAFKARGSSLQYRGVYHASRPLAYAECLFYDYPFDDKQLSIAQWEPPPVPPVDRSARKVLGAAVGPGEADTALGVDGQQKGYVVLSDAERAKGFVRPVRSTYLHTGRIICGKPREGDKGGLEEGKISWVCNCKPDHEGECTSWSQASLTQLLSFKRTRTLNGCGTVTSMGRALAETYARDPGFYGGTFCANCRDHFPVGEFGEFIWNGTDEKVGT